MQNGYISAKMTTHRTKKNQEWTMYILLNPLQNNYVENHYENCYVNKPLPWNSLTYNS